MKSALDYINVRSINRNSMLVVFKDYLDMTRNTVYVIKIDSQLVTLPEFCFSSSYYINTISVPIRLSSLVVQKFNCLPVLCKQIYFVDIRSQMLHLLTTKPLTSVDYSPTLL